jgi:alkylhydroperoxidase family enzyme
VQAVNLHFKCAYTLRARAARAQSLGIDAAALAAIPNFSSSAIFSDTELLVVEYAYAVVRGDVPAALFARVTARFGEKAAIECTAAIAWWAMWAMIINALCPDGA